MPRGGSPACSESACSEVDPAAIKAWRRSERQRLLALRTGAAPVLRREWGREIEARLRIVLAERPGITLGVYWPFKAEFDPRPLVDRLIAAGFAAALPVVVDKKGPLEYRRWRPGDPLIDGVWGIPIPQKREITLPQAVLAPLVGFDRQCYRLGYGGGYFDRTLAALTPRPVAIGVGFELSQLETIHPQDFDIPMDLIVTEAGLRRR
jgi:5-formyltetrahydrofolate cyclo-ligase